MKIRLATISDHEVLVEMFSDLIKTIYKGFKIGEPFFFHRNVIAWFEKNNDVIICEKDDGTVAGFSMGYIEDIGFIEPYYKGEIAYVKPEFRKTRCAYMLYNNLAKYAEQQGLHIISSAYVGDGNQDQVDKLQSRWGKPMFVEYSTAQGANNG